MKPTVDTWLMAIIPVSWFTVALLSLTVPMFHMPGAAALWGTSGAVFIALSLWVAFAEREGST